MAPALKSQLRLKNLVIMVFRGMIVSFILNLLRKYLVDKCYTFAMDKMMLLLPGKAITYEDNMLMKVLSGVLNMAIESFLKFVRKKIAAITETQFVKRMENIICFFKRNNFPEPPIHVV